MVTGPIFEGSSLQRINGRVLVPTFVFKAIYDPIRNEAGAYAQCAGNGIPDALHRRPGKAYRHQRIPEAAGAGQGSQNGITEADAAWVQARKECTCRSQLINEGKI